MSKPQAQVLLERYWDEVNNEGKLELIRELCADPIYRHDPEKVTPLSHDEQIARVKAGIERFDIKISREITHSDDTYVTSVWNMTSSNEGMAKMCGIEVFKVENGRLAHCWNTPYGQGHWG